MKKPTHAYIAAVERYTADVRTARALDIAVAEWLGWQDIHFAAGACPPPFLAGWPPGATRAEAIPYFSTQWSEAAHVIAALLWRKQTLTITPGLSGWIVALESADILCPFEQVPTAICRLALYSATLTPEREL